MYVTNVLISECEKGLIKSSTSDIDESRDKGNDRKWNSSINLKIEEMR